VECLLEWVDTYIQKRYHLGGEGSGNKGHKGRPGKVGGSSKGGGSGKVETDSSIETLKSAKTIVEWKRAVKSLGGKGDRRKKIGAILLKTGHKYETTTLTMDGAEDMYYRGKWDIFVVYAKGSTTVEVHDRYKGWME
jgi:hypothetical protein